MTSLTLEQKIAKAAHLIAEGKVVSFRGASADTYLKVERLANRIKQEREFPQCPCGECDQYHTDTLGNLPNLSDPYATITE